MLNIYDSGKVDEVLALLELFQEAGYSFSIDTAEGVGQIDNLYSAYLVAFNKARCLVGLGGNCIDELKPLANPRHMIHRAVMYAEDREGVMLKLHRSRVHVYSQGGEGGVASLVEFSNLDNPFLA